jgi:hypothetical protein
MTADDESHFGALISIKGSDTATPGSVSSLLSNPPRPFKRLAGVARSRHISPSYLLNVSLLDYDSMEHHASG